MYSLFPILCSSRKISGRLICLKEQKILDLLLRQMKRIASKLKQSWNSYQSQQLTITPTASFRTLNLPEQWWIFVLTFSLKKCRKHSFNQKKIQKANNFWKDSQKLYTLLLKKVNLAEVTLNLWSCLRNHYLQMVLKDAEIYIYNFFFFFFLQNRLVDLTEYSVTLGSIACSIALISS